MKVASEPARPLAANGDTALSPSVAGSWWQRAESNLWLPDSAPRAANAILVAVLIGLSINATIGIIFQSGSWWRILVSMLCVAALLTLQLAYVSRPAARKTWQRTVLAMVLREGVTNVLRHSAANSCEIAIRHIDGAVHMIITNDGAIERAAPVASNAGNGLHNLAHRVAQIGGALTAGTASGGRYELRVDLPRLVS